MNWIKRNLALTVGIFFLFFLILSVIINQRVREEIRKVEKEIPSSSRKVVPEIKPTQNLSGRQESSKQNLPATGEIIKRTRVERGSDITEHVFFIGHREIARQTIAKDGQLTQTGKIPDGKVKFFNDFNNTYGEEYYRNNRKHGLSKTLYQGGQLKSEETYKEGKLVVNKEYYANGILRLEVNYEDARDDKDNKEVGIGKLYFPNGTLRYEWNFTKNNPTAYRKAYHPDGQLRAESYYDEKGRFIEKQPPQ